MSKARLSYLEAGLRKIETAMGAWEGDPFDAAGARIAGTPEEKVRRKPGPKPKPKPPEEGE